MIDFDPEIFLNAIKKVDREIEKQEAIHVRPSDQLCWRSRVRELKAQKKLLADTLAAFIADSKTW
tara:strand:- start:233 stop:427 length:195 start_codon:yes stop_codon:yes gene_type:complete